MTTRSKTGRMWRFCERLEVVRAALEQVVIAHGLCPIARDAQDAEPRAERDEAHGELGATKAGHHHVGDQQCDRVGPSRHIQGCCSIGRGEDRVSVLFDLDPARVGRYGPDETGAGQMPDPGSASLLAGHGSRVIRS